MYELLFDGVEWFVVRVDAMLLIDLMEVFCYSLNVWNGERSSPQCPGGGGVGPGISGLEWFKHPVSVSIISEYIVHIFNF